MSELTTVARPYARAAFEFAAEHKALDKWSQMLTFAACVAQNDSVNELLHGDKTPEALAQIFIQICDSDLDEHGQNFIKVLAENGRLTTLPDVVEQFAELVTAHQNEADVEVTSAVELSESQRAEISAAMEKRLNRQVRLTCEVDASLVAGVIIRAGDLVIDDSVRGKLNRMADTLQS